MEFVDYLRFVFALLFVIGLIAALAWGLRRTGLFPGVAGSTAVRKGKRLHVLESMSLDTRRRLVLVRDGTREHLLLLSGQHDVVVESRDHQPGPKADDDQAEATPYRTGDGP